MTYTYYGTSGNDYFDYTGSDRLYAVGYDGNDTIWGNTKNDSIFGERGDDRLYGWSGNDYLDGGYGNDWLQGSSSTAYDTYEYDTLNGGAYYDTFVLGNSSGNFYRGMGYATILDYNGAEDYIQIKGSASSFRLDQGVNWGGSSALDTAIYSGNDLLAIVQDTTNIQLTSYYFQFV